MKTSAPKMISGNAETLRWREGFSGPLTEGTLVVDIYSADKKELVWRGVVTATLDENPRKAEKKTNKGVAKLCKKYPPPPPKN